MSDFFKDVIEVVKLIPHGKVTSYGMIANYLGAKWTQGSWLGSEERTPK